MSVNMQPCHPALEGLPVETLISIQEMLDYKSKKSLRSTSSFFLELSRMEKQFLKYLMFSKISPDRLKRMADQVYTVKGIEINRITGVCSIVDKSIEYLIRQHPELESFKVGGGSWEAKVTNRSVKALLSHPGIFVIRLVSCPMITGEILVEVSNPKSALKVLDLSECKNLTDTGLVCLLSMIDGDSLTELCLRGTKLTLSAMTSLNAIAAFYNLEVLVLNSCKNLSETGVISLFNKIGEGLKKLDLGGTNLSLSNADLITSRFSKLEELNLVDCPNLSETGVISFLNKRGEELKKLYLVGTYLSLSNAGLITSRFSKLEELRLSNCKNLSETGVISLFNKIGEELKTLYLVGTNLSLSNAGLITRRFSKLEVLSLSKCKNLSETGVISLFNKIGEELKKLYLVGTNLSLSNAGLITSRFSKLEELNLSNCKNLSETGVISLFNKIGEGLKILDLGGTNLSLSDAHLITTSFKRLEELDLGMC